MSTRAIGLGFYQGRAMSFTRTLQRHSGDFPDGANIIAVHYNPGHSITVSLAGDIRLLRDRRVRNLGCVLVVFADKDDRQVPDSGQVQALVKCAVVRSTITKECDADPSIL